MDRRDFLLTFGVGATVAISGYFLLNPGTETKLSNRPVSSDKPELKGEIQFSDENGMFYLSHDKTSCCINQAGKQMISYLDGRHTVIDISREFSAFYSMEFSDSLVSSVSYFVSQLADASFLTAPFYATFYENYA